MQSNYPTGAITDRFAPYNQSDEGYEVCNVGDCGEFTLTICDMCCEPCCDKDSKKVDGDRICADCLKVIEGMEKR